MFASVGRMVYKNPVIWWNVNSCLQLDAFEWAGVWVSGDHRGLDLMCFGEPVGVVLRGGLGVSSIQNPRRRLGFCTAARVGGPAGGLFKPELWAGVVWCFVKSGGGIWALKPIVLSVNPWLGCSKRHFVVSCCSGGREMRVALDPEASSSSVRDHGANPFADRLHYGRAKVRCLMVVQADLAEEELVLIILFRALGEKGLRAGEGCGVFDVCMAELMSCCLNLGEVCDLGFRVSAVRPDTM
ncbi:hypothetical protein Tco_1081819 [Tanacetum coccineum]|uniref:Uncharacterized protein n=1 Tax=Tanacetum coccineum TaxID=301880 RepID=A0ABQ5HZJ2_9ASTR